MVNRSVWFHIYVVDACSSSRACTRFLSFQSGCPDKHHWHARAYGIQVRYSTRPQLLPALRPRSGAQTLTDEYSYNQAIDEESVIRICNQALFFADTVTVLIVPHKHSRAQETVDNSRKATKVANFFAIGLLLLLGTLQSVVLSVFGCLFNSQAWFLFTAESMKIPHNESKIVPELLSRSLHY